MYWQIICSCYCTFSMTKTICTSLSLQSVFLYQLQPHSQRKYTIVCNSLCIVISDHLFKLFMQWCQTYSCTYDQYHCLSQCLIACGQLLYRIVGYFWRVFWGILKKSLSAKIISWNLAFLMMRTCITICNTSKIAISKFWFFGI